MPKAYQGLFQVWLRQNEIWARRMDECGCIKHGLWQFLWQK